MARAAAPYKLFRRHRKNCIKSYDKEDRVYEFDNAKATGRGQCDCPIAVEGKVGKLFLKAKSTETNDWNKARIIVNHWANRSRTDSLPEQPEELVTVKASIEDFCVVQRNKPVSYERMQQYSQLLELRLIPFAKTKNLNFIQEMDNPKVWSQFRDSWKDENPFRNRVVEGPRPKRKVGRTTASRMIGDLRTYLKFCVKNGWLSDNYASKDYGMLTTKIKDPKDPFSDQDLLYIYRAAELITDGKGWNQKRTLTQNAFEDLVFAFVLRYTGLRISDVTALSREQLVPFQQGIWTHAISCFPRKTRNTRQNGNHVLIPMLNGALPGHPNVVAALESLPLKHGRYFFLGGGPLPAVGTQEWNDRIKYATNNWRERINRLMKNAAKLMEAERTQFSVHPHPHRFRHTFAAWLLRHGMSLRQVAEYLGDTEETVRSHYGKFCIAEQREAARALEEAMLGPQQAAVVGFNFTVSPFARLLQ